MQISHANCHLAPRARCEHESSGKPLRAAYTSDRPARIEHATREAGNADETIDRSDEAACDLMTLVSPGRSSLRHLRVASMAELSLRQACCPGMVPREPTSDRLAGQDVVILHPTDFSAASEEALYIARDLAQACGARLLILFVLPRGLEEEIQFFARFGPPHCALASLSKKVNGTAPGFPVEVRISEGDAAAEIVRFAGEIECGLVVMGTHGRRGIGRLPKGGVAEQVLRIIDRPVLVVKPARSGPVLEIGRSKAAARSETRMAISTPGQARIRRRP